jgi:hypothetical protein
MCEARTQQYFIAKKKQKQNKKMFPKLMLNILKVMGNSTFIIPIGHLSQKKNSINFQPTCGPCSAMYGPYVNYE